jgi:hypothetical protein
MDPHYTYTVILVEASSSEAPRCVNLYSEERCNWSWSQYATEMQGSSKKNPDFDIAPIIVHYQKSGKDYKIEKFGEPSDYVIKK